MKKCNQIFILISMASAFLGSIQIQAADTPNQNELSESSSEYLFGWFKSFRKKSKSEEPVTGDEDEKGMARQAATVEEKTLADAHTETGGRIPLYKKGAAIKIQTLASPRTLMYVEDPNYTFGDIKKKIEEITKIPVDRQEIKIGMETIRDMNDVIKFFEEDKTLVVRSVAPVEQKIQAQQEEAKGKEIAFGEKKTIGDVLAKHPGFKGGDRLIFIKTLSKLGTTSIDIGDSDTLRDILERIRDVMKIEANQQFDLFINNKAVTNIEEYALMPNNSTLIMKYVAR